MVIATLIDNPELASWIGRPVDDAINKELNGDPIVFSYRTAWGAGGADKGMRYEIQLTPSALRRKGYVKIPADIYFDIDFRKELALSI